jgi:hypothetical protein
MRVQTDAKNRVFRKSLFRRVAAAGAELRKSIKNNLLLD